MSLNLLALCENSAPSPTFHWLVFSPLKERQCGVLVRRGILGMKAAGTMHHLCGPGTSTGIQNNREVLVTSGNEGSRRLNSTQQP